MDHKIDLGGFFGIKNNYRKYTYIHFSAFIKVIN